MTKTEILQNLKCDGCTNTITNTFNKITGFSHTKIEIESHSVSFEYSYEYQIYTVERKFARLGYPIDTDSNSILQKAKSFVSCVVGRLSKKKSEEFIYALRGIVE